MPEAGPQIY